MKAGKQKVSYYYTDASKAQDYAPTNVKVRKSYGKNVIYWDKRELTDSIYYAVYRGESADFTPDDSTLVRGAIKDSYCMDTRVEMARVTIIKYRHRNWQWMERSMEKVRMHYQKKWHRIHRKNMKKD